MEVRTRRAPSRKGVKPALKKKPKQLSAAILPWVRILGASLAFGTLAMVAIVWSLTRAETGSMSKEFVLALPPTQSGVLTAPPKVVRKPLLSVVLDDAGYSLTDLKPFLELPFPLAIAILPFQAHSSESLKATLAAGKTAMLHMPMEPLGTKDPGVGSLLVADSPEIIRAKLNAAIDSLPGIIGINNHMGSRFTSNLEAMRVVMEEVKQQGLFFLDSFTHPTSVVMEAARLESAAVLRRDVFADHSTSETDVHQALNNALAKATTEGSALVIGHVGSPELASYLSRLYENNKNNFRFVAPQDLLK